MTLLRLAGRIFLTTVAAAFLSASLVRFAPGADVAEERLDARLSPESVARIEGRTRDDLNLLGYYRRRLSGWVRGDFGDSRTLGRPVAELLRERIGSTVTSIGAGLAVAWAGGMAAGICSLYKNGALPGMFASGLALLLQCVPAAAVGLILAVAGGRGPHLCGFAVGLVLYPRVLQYGRNLLLRAHGSSHVLAARARGVGRMQILWRHVLPAAGPQLISFAAVSVSMAISAAVPLEAILDVPGIGQLAWQAALGRDLNLLVNITALVGLVIVLFTSLSELLAERLSRGLSGEERADAMA